MAMVSDDAAYVTLRYRKQPQRSYSVLLKLVDLLPNLDHTVLKHLSYVESDSGRAAPFSVINFAFRLIHSIATIGIGRRWKGVHANNICGRVTIIVRVCVSDSSLNGLTTSVFNFKRAIRSAKSPRFLVRGEIFVPDAVTVSLTPRCMAHVMSELPNKR